MFTAARIRLTAWYLLIIMVVSLSFSAVIYGALNNELNRISHMSQERLQRLYVQQDPQGDVTFQQAPSAPRFSDEEINGAREHIINNLLLINLGIFAVSGVLGYFLAGMTLRPIEDMLEEQRRFVSDASHELKTPLTSLKTAFEVSMRDKALSLTDAKTLIGESIDEVNRLQKLSENLLLLSRHEQQIQTRMTPLALERIVSHALHNVRPLAKAKHITLSMALEDIMVRGNEDSLKHLIIILLDNAIKYSPDGTTITTRVSKKGRSAVLQVQDEGIGMEKNDVEHIFDRFYRADSARTLSGTSGYGLGLSIARNIIEEHRGTVHVVSEVGKGTTFTIVFPLFS